MAKCKYCDANVIWAKTAKGKMTPMDSKPVDDGEWGLDFNGDTSSPPLAHRAEAGILTRYTPHWATCPAARKARDEARERRGE
jgi:hypothetical protein